MTLCSQNRPDTMTLDYGQALDKQRQVRGPYVNVGEAWKTCTSVILMRFGDTPYRH